MNKINNKVIYLYSAFFILFFIFLFLLDIIYKKYVVNSSLGYHYKISANQAYDLKENIYDKVLEDILIFDQKKNINQKDDIFRVKNFEKTKIYSNYTINTRISNIKFSLILSEKIEPNELKIKINEKYLRSINEVIADIEANLGLFDYKTLKKEYEDLKLNRINEGYNELINSSFFKKLPPPTCASEEMKNCYKFYITYYKTIFEKIDSVSSQSNLVKLFNFYDNTDEGVLKIIKEFYSNRNLFDNDEFNKLLFNNSGVNLTSEFGFLFYSNKFDKLRNSTLFKKYISNPDNYCRSYRMGCLEGLSDHFNNLLYEHRKEQKNKFEIELIEKKIKDKKFINEVPKILGLAIFLTYIFFILTNKFFKRKLR
jgi:hypothetical protein